MRLKLVMLVAIALVAKFGFSQEFDTTKFNNLNAVGVTAKTVKKNKQAEIDLLYTSEFLDKQISSYEQRHNYLSDRLEDFERMLKGSSRSKLILSSTGDYKPSIYTVYYESSNGTKKFCEEVNVEISNISTSNSIQATERAKYIYSLQKMKNNLTDKTSKVNTLMYKKLKT